MKNNTKQFWSYLKSKKQDSQGVTPLRKDDGFLYSDTIWTCGLVTVDIVEQFQHSSLTNVYIWHIRI
jgi:hypothetical protein